jgi:uncharacterized protein (DUF736 family)
MNTQSNNNNKNQNELGALWKKKSKTGLSFLSGYINDHDGQRIDVVVFANSNKKNEKAPDYRLYVSKPLENKDTPKVEPKKVVKKTEAVDSEEELF